MEENLNWAEFAPASKADWERAAEHALKGKSAAEWLVKNLVDELRIPAYADGSDVEGTDAIPGKAPWTRGIRRENNDWIIVQEFGGDREELSNPQILNVLNEGVNGLSFRLNEAATLGTLLKDVWVGILDVQIQSDHAQTEILQAFSEIAMKQEVASASLRYGILTDPIPGIEPAKPGFDTWIQASRLAAELPGVIRTANIDCRFAGDVNAPASFQLAIALAKGHDALHKLLDAGINVDEAAAMIQFSFTTGPDYFTEIAKYRAFRVIWHQVVAQYGPQHGCSSGTFVHAESCRWNKSAKDRYNNLLRGTMESMAAILGGADSVLNLPADVHMNSREKLSERWSRNIQFMLRDESFLHRVADASGGSWYIEKTGRILAEEAWKRFQEIEKAGGFVAFRSSGELKKRISEYREALLSGLGSGAIRWIGVNKYPATESVESNNWFENALTGQKRAEA